MMLRKLDIHPLLIRSLLCLIFIFLFQINYLSFASGPSMVPIFSDVSEMAGLTSLKRSKTYSAAVADYNLDGYLDFVLSHHGKLSLWKNNKDGSFSEATDLLGFNEGDTHGISFIDINDDYYPDIAVSCGADRGRGEGKNFFLLNNGGKTFSLFNNASEILLDKYGRGRSIAPTEMNGDGLVDYLIFNFFQKGRPHRLASSNVLNSNYSEHVNFTSISAVDSFGVKTIDLNNDGRKFLITTGPGRDSGRIYNQKGNGFYDVTKEMGVATESAISSLPFDADSDGDMDLLFAHRKFARPRGAGVVNGEILFSYFGGKSAHGFSALATNGKLIIDVLIEGKVIPNLLYLGKEKFNARKIPYEIDVNSQVFQGEPVINNTKEPGVYLWRSTDGYLHFKFVGNKNLQQASGIISLNDSGFKGIDEGNLAKLPNLISNSFYFNEQGKFQQSAKDLGISGGGLAWDLIAADFNNDNLLDVYQVNSGYQFSLTNPPNNLFMNLGDGIFQDVTSTSNTEGTDEGAGNGAIAFDYDNDGDLDLLLFNGFTRYPVKPGPVVLLRNDTKNIGKSIVLIIKSAKVNKRGWGTRIISQVGEKRLYQQKYGLNGYLSTSDLPFHIGLGSATIADNILIKWPSGREQILEAVKPGRYFITEPDGHF